MDAEVYPQARISKFITEHFVPVKVHIKEHPKDFAPFRAQRSPTIIVAIADGTERHGIVGYLPAEELLVQSRLASPGPRSAVASLTLRRRPLRKSSSRMLGPRRPRKRFTGGAFRVIKPPARLSP